MMPWLRKGLHRIRFVPVVVSISSAVAAAYVAREVRSAPAALAVAALIGVLGAIAAVYGGMSHETRASRRTVRVQAPYDLPPNRVHALLTEVLAGIEGLDRERPPACRTIGGSAGSMDYEVEFGVRDDAVAEEITSTVATRVWYAIQRSASASEPPPSAEEAPRVALATLNASPLFARLPAEIRQDLAERAEIELWAAGERVVEQGTAADSCFIVRLGRLAVHISSGEAEAHVATLRVGDLFGEMSLLTGDKRWATVRAAEDCELLKISAPALRGALRRSPELVQALAETVALRREELERAQAFMAISSEPAAS